MINYENGYLPKIAFHAANDNLKSAEFFIDKHIENYGKLSSADMMFIFDEMASIKRSRAQETNEFNNSLDIQSYTL